MTTVDIPTKVDMETVKRIRLVAGLLGVTQKEVVKRAVICYINQHKAELEAIVARLTDIESG